MNRLRVRSCAILLLAVLPAIGALAQTPLSDDLRVYLDADRLLELIQEEREDVILVDTRTEPEYLSGHIPGAIQIDYRDISNNLPTEDRNVLVIVYCERGIRSNRAAGTLRRLGFVRVLDWGGIRDWPYERVVGPSQF